MKSNLRISEFSNLEMDQLTDREPYVDARHIMHLTDHAIQNETDVRLASVLHATATPSSHHGGLWKM